MTSQFSSLRQDFRHILPLQIRFNDIDKFGHVNNAVYFQFYDTAKTEYISEVCPHVDWNELAIIVAHIEADFLAQVKADSHLEARTRVSRIGRKSFQLEQELVESDTQEVKSRCMSVMVLYDLVSKQTIPLPADWVKAIREYEEGEAANP